MSGAALGNWTPERKARAAELWAQGLSASQIARDLGGVSRNAVIGVIHRMGLSGRATPSKPQRVANKTTRLPKAASEPRPQRYIPKIAMAAPVLPISVPGRPPTAADFEPASSDAFAPLPGITPVLLIDRPKHGCAWPVGEDDEGRMLVCGDQAATRWCASHDALNRSKVRTKTSAADLLRSLRRYV